MFLIKKKNTQTNKNRKENHIKVIKKLNLYLEITIIIESYIINWHIFDLLVCFVFFRFDVVFALQLIGGFLIRWKCIGRRRLSIFVDCCWWFCSDGGGHYSHIPGTHIGHILRWQACYYLRWIVIVIVVAVLWIVGVCILWRYNGSIVFVDVVVAIIVDICI